MKNVRLFHSATIVGDVPGTEAGDKALTKRARLVYEGEFESMDGPVKVTADHLTALAEAHNAKLVKLSAGATTMADYPPVQVDHSTSGWDTVGRVIGPLELGTDTIDGKQVVALFGNLRFLGADAVERVRDGRWTHLSLGADLDGAKLNEMTVTPFPAAPKASLLSKGKGDSMDEKKMAALKKHLMEKEKLSEKDADDKLAAMSAEDQEKMSASLSVPGKTEGPDKSEADAEKGAKDSKTAMAAARKGFAKLTKGFRETAAKTVKSVSKAQLTAKLNGLRAKGKLTPAEQKEIDVDKLSALDASAQDLFFETWEKRLPVVMGGIALGSTDSKSITELAKDVQGKKMMAEMAESMQFSKGVVRRLAGMPTSMDPGQQRDMAAANIGSSVGNDNAMPTSMDHQMDMSAHFAHAHKLVSEGKHEEAMQHLAQCMEKCKAMKPADDAMSGTEGPAHLSALAESLQSLQNQFEELVTLTTPILGTTEE